MSRTASGVVVVYVHDQAIRGNRSWHAANFLVGRLNIVAIDADWIAYCKLNIFADRPTHFVMSIIILNISITHWIFAPEKISGGFSLSVYAPAGRVFYVLDIYHELVGKEDMRWIFITKFNHLL